jgi:hypothetical protein
LLGANCSGSSGDSMTASQLTGRDLEILRHVALFRRTTFRTLHDRFFSGQKKDAVKSTLRRLCGPKSKYRLLEPERWSPRCLVYRLTRSGARVIGAAAELSRPLGQQARITHLAELFYFHQQPTRKLRLVSNDQLRQFLNLTDQRLPRRGFFLEQTPQGELLGYLLVDHGGDARRLARKAAGVLKRFLKKRWFDEFLRADRFVITMVTLSPNKKQRLQKLLQHRLEQDLAPLLAPLGKTGSPFRFEVIPGLIDLIIGRERPDKKELSP